MSMSMPFMHDKLTWIYTSTDRTFAVLTTAPQRVSHAMAETVYVFRLTSFDKNGNKIAKRKCVGACMQCHASDQMGTTDAVYTCVVLGTATLQSQARRMISMKSFIAYVVDPAISDERRALN